MQQQNAGKTRLRGPESTKDGGKAGPEGPRGRLRTASGVAYVAAAARASGSMQPGSSLRTLLTRSDTR